MIPTDVKYKEPVELERLIRHLQRQGKSIVFTNGCFDLIHPGHVRYLAKARSHGDILVVALNSDDSVRKIKGRDRPILNQRERCEVVAALESVSYVTIFEEETPLEIIRRIQPDVLVKGGDWTVERIVGREVVEGRGGRVLSIAFEDGFSTTELIRRITDSAQD